MNPEFQQIIVPKYVFEKIYKNDVVTNIPTEPIFYEFHNYREIVGIYPQWLAMDSSIWQLKVISVSNDNILITEISTNINTMAMFLARCLVSTSLTSHEILCRKVLLQLQSLVNQDRVDEEIFTNKLHTYYQKINTITYYEK